MTNSVKTEILKCFNKHLINNFRLRWFTEKMTPAFESINRGEKTHSPFTVFENEKNTILVVWIQKYNQMQFLRSSDCNCFKNTKLLYESVQLLPFFVGASWTDSVMSFWLAGRIGLSDSACFLFMSLLNCLLSAQVRNFFTVTCSKSKHFSRYERNSSSSVRWFYKV